MRVTIRSVEFASGHDLDAFVKDWGVIPTERLVERFLERQHARAFLRAFRGDAPIG